MSKQKKLCLVAAVGTVVTFLLRLLQQLTGFENDTGLAVNGHPAGLAVVVLFAAAAVCAWVFSGSCEKENRAFRDVFSTESAAELTVLVMGLFLMAAGGVFQVMFGVMGGGLERVLYRGGMMGVVWMGNMSPVEVLVLGVCAAAPAVCLFPAAAACRRREDGEVRSFRSELLLVPVVCMVVRLVLLYRVHSINPVLQAYYVELLAVVFVTLAFYQLAGFAVEQGRLRWYSVCTNLAVLLCVTTLADGHDISGMALYGGCALTLAGFRLLYREASPVEEVYPED